MITQIILNFIATTIATVVGWIPNLPASVMNSAARITGYLSELGGTIAATGVIMPWAAFVGVVGVWLGALAVAFGIWVSRFVVSLVTGGGGAS